MFVIYRKRNRAKAMKKNTAGWIKTIHQQLAANNSNICPKHKKHLLKSLIRTGELIAFSHALKFFNRGDSKDLYKAYVRLLAQSTIFQQLALVYKKKKNAERAYFAYFISIHPLVVKSEDIICKNTTDTMVSFTKNADIYCRVNVLKALCKLGDLHGLVSVLQLYSNKAAFIHHKLLAEDLYNFAGDKDKLALKLWENYKLWSNNILLGVITFITIFSDMFKTAFLPVLQNQYASIDIRIALIHYYKKYIYEPALPIMLEYLTQTKSYELAIAAATTLSAYPGRPTTNALTSALESENWYVRYSAVSSLVELDAYPMGVSLQGVRPDMFINNAQSRDSNVQQMIEYKLDHANEKYVNASEVII